MVKLLSSTMALLHPESSIATVSQLDLFDIPPTIAQTEDGIFVTHKPVTNVADSGQLILSLVIWLVAPESTHQNPSVSNHLFLSHSKRDLVIADPLELFSR